MQFTNYQLPITNYPIGFTLVELLVAITLMAILSVISGAAIPRVRTHQALIADTQELRAFLRNAQQRAINEDRTKECLDNSSIVAIPVKKCSDIGVAMIQNTGRVVMFADLDGDHRYRGTPTSFDFFLLELDLRSTFQVDREVVFESKPPFFDMYAGGSATPSGVVSFTLELNGVQKQMELYPYGQLEEVN